MTIKQNKKTKTWYSRVSYKDGDKYKTKSKYSFKTKKEAQLWENKIQDQLSSGVNIGSNPVFAEYFLNWFRLYKEPKVSNPTKVNYMATYAKLKDYFKDTKIKNVNRKQYQGFLNHYGEKLARTTMQKTNKHIRACVQDAVENGELARDFTYKAELNGNSGKSEDVKYLSESETKKLIVELNNGLDDTMLTRNMALLALATGMRYAELAGLTFDSFNFKDNTLKINKTWNFGKQKFKPTKSSAGVRTIKVEPTIMNTMQQFIKRQRANQLSRSILNPHKLVFAQYDGTPPTNNGANKSLRRACKRAGVQLITFHPLRHTHVSILLYRGMDIHSIAKRIGHSSPLTTMEVYAHVIKELEHKSDLLSDAAVSKLFSV